jgi:hypothetical protein
VIWLVWHRYRFLAAATVVVLAALGLWMVLAGRALEAAEASFVCRHGKFGCDIASGVFSLSNQATAINFLLLFVPCLIGLVFGAPLVAGELEHSTNRLAWTQGISRTRWLLVKWVSLALCLVALVALLTLLSQWWTGHAIERISANFSELGGGRLQPLYFPITGIALGAYTLFAFALGCALGALLHKTAWAIVGTIVLYTAVSLLLLLVVRPSLAPQVFVPDPLPGQPINAASEARDGAFAFGSWNLGFGYRYGPGARSTGASAGAVAQRCEDRNNLETPYLACLARNGVQEGVFYQPTTHYWDLQWGESAILAAAAGALLGVTVLSVRRWRA